MQIESRETRWAAVQAPSDVRSDTCTSPTYPRDPGGVPVPQCHVATAAPPESMATSGRPTFWRSLERLVTGPHANSLTFLSRARTTYTAWRRRIPRAWTVRIRVAWRHTTTTRPVASTATCGSMARRPLPEITWGGPH